MTKSFTDFLREMDGSSPSDSELLESILSDCIRYNVITEDEHSQLDELRKKKKSSFFETASKTLAIALQRKMITLSNQIINSRDIGSKINLLSKQNNINASLNLLSVAMQNSERSILSKVGALAAVRT